MLYPQNDDRIVAIDSVMSLHPLYMGNESVLKIIINNTINLLFQTAISILLPPNHNSFRVLFDKIASYILFEKYIYILCPRTGAIPISIRHFPPGIAHSSDLLRTIIGAAAAEKLDGTSDGVDTDITDPFKIFHAIFFRYFPTPVTPVHFSTVLSVSPLNLASHNARLKITKNAAKVNCCN